MLPSPKSKTARGPEAAAAETLADEGHLVRLWKASGGTGRTTVLGLYRAGSEAELDGLLGALPLYEWMHTSIAPLVQHPNDPVGIRAKAECSVTTPCATTPNGFDRSAR
jgi:muconolactone delta-isomerase